MPYRFGCYTLDEHVFELRRDAQLLPLRRQSFDVLHYLISHRDRLVPKEELGEQIWKRQRVEENSFSQCIADIRQALGVTGRDNEYIRTVRGRGFQFVAATQATVLPFPSTWSSSAAAPADETPRVTRVDAVAVLPFQSASGRPREVELGKGIAEDLLRCLAGWRFFPVISASSTWSYQREHRSVPQVARDLGAAFIVEGTVQREASRVRVRVHLSDAEGTELWAERFDAAAEDLFALQDEVAETIARAMYPELVRGAIQRVLRRPPESLGAWELALRGLQHVYLQSRDDHQRAIEMFERACARDGRFVLPLFQWGHAHYMNVYHQWTDDWAGEIACARRAAEQCLEIDITDPAGHMLSGLVNLFTGEGERALGALHRAVDANPSHAGAHSLLGQILAVQSQPQESIQHVKLAMRLSPRDPRGSDMFTALAMGHFVGGEYAQARDAAERAALRSPHVIANHLCIASSSAWIGELGRAREAVERLRVVVPHFSLTPFRHMLSSSSAEVQQSFFGGL